MLNLLCTGVICMNTTKKVVPLPQITRSLVKRLKLKLILSHGKNCVVFLCKKRNELFCLTREKICSWSLIFQINQPYSSLLFSSSINPNKTVYESSFCACEATVQNINFICLAQVFGQACE